MKTINQGKQKGVMGVDFLENQQKIMSKLKKCKKMKPPKVPVKIDAKKISMKKSQGANLKFPKGGKSPILGSPKIDL